LVLGRNRLSQVSEKLSENDTSFDAVKELHETSTQIDFITTELQLAVMKTRMVPIAKVFNRIPRLVRDLAKETGKEVELHLSGEETELDKSIIEELTDPLIHIIRNAIDHGIETPQERTANGKSVKGRIDLRAEHEGNHIIITSNDDGRGIDLERLKKKAVEKGLLTVAHAQEISKQETLNLIFLPGFSTAATVTSLSGRGVGMDVVRTNIQKLKGSIEIVSEVGKGTSFRLKLPLTLAIVQGLLVETSGEVFAIPLSSVKEVVRISTNDIAYVNQREVIRIRSEVLSLARLTDIVGLRHIESRADYVYVVVIGWSGQNIGIVVDSLLGQKEVVFKSLGSYLGDVPAIAGSTILGDGRVILIVDVATVISVVTKSFEARAATVNAPLRARTHGTQVDSPVESSQHADA
jgi:two-component system, chemotaxis family, sensor kinase CheA